MRPAMYLGVYKAQDCVWELRYLPVVVSHRFEWLSSAQLKFRIPFGTGLALKMGGRGRGGEGGCGRKIQSSYLQWLAWASNCLFTFLVWLILRSDAFLVVLCMKLPNLSGIQETSGENSPSVVNWKDGSAPTSLRSASANVAGFFCMLKVGIKPAFDLMTTVCLSIK